MIKLIRKFIGDTLMIKGKYSMKRVIVAIFVPYTLNIGMIIVRNNNVNAYAIQVFTGLLAFITLIVAGTIVAKIKEIKTNENTLNE
jgi:hypothetical protein